MEIAANRAGVCRWVLAGAGALALAAAYYSWSDFAVRNSSSS